jgi:hypothetical protein
MYLPVVNDYGVFVMLKGFLHEFLLLSYYMYMLLFINTIVRPTAHLDKASEQ